MFVFAIIGIITVVVIIVYAVQSSQSSNNSPPPPSPSRSVYSPSTYTSPSYRPVTPTRKSPDLIEVHDLWRVHAQKLFDYLETMRSVNYISEDIVFESLTAFYIISLTFSNKRLDASSVLSDYYMNEVFEEPMFREYKDKFWPRVNLYKQALNTRKIRCECVPDLPESEKMHLDSLSQITLIYGDLLWNPACASDYFNAPNRSMDAFAYALFCPEYMDGLHDILSDWADAWGSYTKSLG